MDNQGQGHSEGQGRLVGHVHKVLRSLYGQFRMDHTSCYQIMGTILSKGHGLNVDVEQSLITKGQCHCKVKVMWYAKYEVKKFNDSIDSRNS